MRSNTGGKRCCVHTLFGLKIRARGETADKHHHEKDDVDLARAYLKKKKSSSGKQKSRTEMSQINVSLQVRQCLFATFDLLVPLPVSLNRCVLESQIYQVGHSFFWFISTTWMHHFSVTTEYKSGIFKCPWLINLGSNLSWNSRKKWSCPSSEDLVMSVLASQLDSWWLTFQDECLFSFFSCVVKCGKSLLSDYTVFSLLTPLTELSSRCQEASVLTLRRTKTLYFDELTDQWFLFSVVISRDVGFLRNLCGQRL